jgi:phage protein D
VIDADVVNTNHLGSDRFHVRAALNADLVGLTALVDQPEIMLEVQISLDGGASFTSLIQGEVDQVELDPIGGVVEFSGRDLSAGLIEARTQEIFANKTSSEIAGILAARHGLLVDAQATTTPVGRYWELEHDRIVLNQFGRATTEWDLLVTLAQHEQFDVWVSGTTLHFRPPVTVMAPLAVLRPQAMAGGAANVSALRMERCLTLASALQVTVKSWNSLKGTAFTQTASSGSPGGRARNYVYVVPNLTPDDALAFAQARLGELAQHERVISVEMPGELTLMPRGMVRVEGTFTAFDQSYWIDRVERHVSMTHGFTQSLRAKNGSVG